MRNLAFRGLRLPRLGAMRSGVSILALFAAGVVGAWYDPSDLPTIFQDSAGTTPVTAAGQPVGLMLDKSQGLVLGPEIGSNSFSDWTAVSASGSISEVGDNVVLEIINLDSPARAYITLTTVVGKFYKVQIPHYFSAADKFRLRFGTSIGGTQYGEVGTSFDGPLNWHFRATSTSFIISMNGIATALQGDTVSVSTNISVRLLTGNHAVQATAAKRPIYGFHPFGGVRNLLTRTEQFDNAAWIKTNITAVPDAATAPDGTGTFDKLIAPAVSGQHSVRQIATVTSGINYTCSVFAKAAEVGFFSLFPQGATSASANFNLDTGVSTNGSVTTNLVGHGIEDVGGGIYRCWITVTTTGTSLNFNAYLRQTNTTDSAPHYAGDGVSGLFIWGIQVEEGSTTTAYQKVVTQDEVTEAGVPSVHRLCFDGIDDSMQTAAIDFTGTDKVSVFAGVRKLSDVNTAIVTELGSNTQASFYLAAPGNSAATNFVQLSRGTVGSAATAGSLAAPVTVVTAGTMHIAADLNNFRVNGVLTSSVLDQGTGTFGNIPLNIGARGGTSLFFNGNLYGLVIPGKLVSDAEIASTEAYMAGKTGVVL